jgi:hypothetical protein
MKQLLRLSVFLLAIFVSAPSSASMFASCIIEGEVTSEGVLIREPRNKQKFEIRVLTSTYRPQSWGADPNACPDAGENLKIEVGLSTFTRKIKYRSGDYIKIYWQVIDGGFGGGLSIRVLAHKRLIH